jgi:hypothetical protein
MRWGVKDAVAIGGVAPVGWYVITRIAQRLKKEDLQFDNGDGIQSGRIQLIHGVVWDITVRDSTLMVPPRVGQYIQIVDLGGMFGALNAGWAYKECVAYVMDSNYDAAPKQPGERVLVVERIGLIEGT